MTMKPTSSHFPPWLKKRIPISGQGQFVTNLLDDLELQTVCKNARCPNSMECFAKRTATFMIMGNLCSRNCGFCAVQHAAPELLDPQEPARVAEAARRMKLRHVVVTSVTRDDLPDGGAEHFRQTIRALRERTDCTIEVLTPDFQGVKERIKKVVSARPTVFNHNVETVLRLYPKVRPQANYERSLSLLAYVKEIAPDMTTKSGLMVGLGESYGEVIGVMRDLREVGCDILTIGQYLRPSKEHLPVVEYIHPDVFDHYNREAKALGFLAVSSGPFVRSSHNAEEVYLEADSVARG